MTILGADYYDRWYSDVIQSPARDAIVQRTLGLPAGLQSTGAIGWDALAEVVVALGLSHSDTVLDLACGRGGYGMEVIRRTGARMVGVDFSAVAIQQARRQAEACGLADRARFVLGDMADTGLDTSSVDAVLCIDSIQFANPISVILGECRRVLKPRGCVVLTAWQLVDATDEQFRRRSGHRDLAVELRSAGFEQVQVSERPAWHAAERAMWLEASSTDAADDPALQTMRDEAKRVLSVFDMRQRVLATAIAPAQQIRSEPSRIL